MNFSTAFEIPRGEKEASKDDSDVRWKLNYQEFDQICLNSGEFLTLLIQLRDCFTRDFDFKLTLNFKKIRITSF